MRAALALTLCLIGCAGERPAIGVNRRPAPVPRVDVSDAPPDLDSTGLYLPGSRTIARDVYAYKPAFELWSDGATKARWIHLPPHTKVDVSDMNEWIFPVGTKLWKEFRVPVRGRLRRVETRLLWKTAEDQWVRAVYAWSQDESRATVLTAGIDQVPGTNGYAIPPQTACVQCHAGRIDGVLGFEAILLAAPEAEGLDYDELLRRGWLDGGEREPAPSSGLQIPGVDIERRALGLLHVDCGVSCHHARGGATHFETRLVVDAEGHVGSVEATRVYRTAVNAPSKLRPAGAAPDAATFYRIRPADPAKSTVLYTMRVRDAPGTNVREQMPPLASKRPDEEGARTIEAWIRQMSAPAH